MTKCLCTDITLTLPYNKKIPSVQTQTPAILTDVKPNQNTEQHNHLSVPVMWFQGITFLCLVGLSGDETQDKIAHTLQSAFWIHETCQREIDSLW